MKSNYRKVAWDAPVLSVLAVEKTLSAEILQCKETTISSGGTNITTGGYGSVCS